MRSLPIDPQAESRYGMTCDLGPKDARSRCACHGPKPGQGWLEVVSLC